MKELNDREIINQLRDRFIPVAVIKSTHSRADAEGDFYRKMLGNVRLYTQSELVVCTADGKLLGTLSATPHSSTKDLLRTSLENFRPPNPPPSIEPAGQEDPKFAFRPPEGGAVVAVIMKQLTAYQGALPAKDPHHQTWESLLRSGQNQVQLDRLWVTKEEVQALARDTFPESLKTRLARHHMVHYAGFRPSEVPVKKFDVRLSGGHLSGSFQSTFYDATLCGRVEVRDGKLTQFDLQAKGRYESEYAGPLLPYDLAIGFTLADLKDPKWQAAPYKLQAHGWDFYYRP